MINSRIKALEHGFQMGQVRRCLGSPFGDLPPIAKSTDTYNVPARYSKNEKWLVGRRSGLNGCTDGRKSAYAAFPVSGIGAPWFST
jgi:hypothetical protein